MKLLPSPTTLARDAGSNDSFGHAVSQGFEAVMVMAIFLGGGWALDAWLGTRPWFAIALLLVGFVGMFYAWRMRYEARMAAHEAQRHRAITDVDVDASDEAAAGKAGPR